MRQKVSGGKKRVMKSKILFSDIDDTLLNKDKSISEMNRKAILKMLEQGHYFVAVTGKPIEIGRKVIKDLELTMPGCYMVAFSGAVIYDCAVDRVLSESTLPMDVVREILEEADKEGIHVQTYQKNYILTREHNEELDFYLEGAQMPYKLVPDIFGCLEKEPNKVTAISVDGSAPLQELKKNFEIKHPKMKESYNCFFSSDEYLEFCPKGIDKEIGVKYLSKFLNIPLEDTVAIGDERNDISMIRAAKVGVAVENAILELKKAADYVTKNDYEHGAVAEVIERFILK